MIVDESGAEVEVVGGLVIFGCGGRGSSEGLDWDGVVFGGLLGIGICWLELPWPWEARLDKVLRTEFRSEALYEPSPILKLEAPDGILGDV